MTTHQAHHPGALPQAGHGQRRRSMWPLYAIVLMSLAPVVAAFLAYFVPQSGLRPDGHNNYGRILDPQRPMPSTQALPLTTLEGRPFNLESLRGQWVLVSADDAACPESCVRKLFILRNSHASQGKNVERLSRIWFVTDDGAVPQAVLDAYTGTHMVRADPAALASFLTADRSGQQGIEALRNHMWIIDPLGNLMMEFPPNADPIEVRDDIIKLLKRSRIG
ncbi:hypothetical protein VRY85_03040 [Achromobacter sp. F4_2707]|uniref:SCO family protein n=1 Tax=Achromobacter sp. F4_2707 TaxID=3114286 RepID=UPI0039C6325E